MRPQSSLVAVARKSQEMSAPSKRSRAATNDLETMISSGATILTSMPSTMARRALSNQPRSTGNRPLYEQKMMSMQAPALRALASQAVSVISQTKPARMRMCRTEWRSSGWMKMSTSLVVRQRPR